MSTRQINALLKKMDHFDADERYMAINDLIKQLKDLSKIEQSLQVPIRKAIIKALEDKGADVATIAVRALQLCVEKFNPEQIVVIVENMGEMLVSPDKTEARDIYAEGLETVLAVCDPETGAKIAPKLIKNIEKGLSGGKKGSDEEAKDEIAAMAVLIPLLEKFGNDVKSSLPRILQSILQLLEHPYESARLEACQALGPLTPYLANKEFKQLMEKILKKIQTSENPGIYIQSIVVISKFAALRVSNYLGVLVPLLIDFCKKTVFCGKDSENLEIQITIWSNCLEALSSLIQRCPNSISKFLDNIIKLSIKKVTFDPNLAQDDDDQKMDGGDDDDDDDEFFETENQADWGADDEDGGDGGDGWGAEDEVPVSSADESWKVRRAAVRVLSMFINVRNDLLKEYVDDLVKKLVSRFHERDTSVQEQVFHAFKELIHETYNRSTNEELESDESFDKVPDSPPVTLMRQRSFGQTVRDFYPEAIKGLSAAFTKASVQSKKIILIVLKEIVLMEQGGMAQHFDLFMGHVLYSLTATEKSSVLNEDAILLTKILFEYHTFRSLSPYFEKLASAAAKVVEEAGNVLIKPKALQLCGIIAVKAKGHCVEEKKLETVVRDLFKTTYSQLEQKANIENIKKASIDAMAMILASHGDILDKKCEDSLKILQQRLSNEVTRVSAMRAISKIANSEVKVDLTSIVSKSIQLLSGFLRQISKGVKSQTMLCLNSLVRTHGKKISAKDYTYILEEVAPHISDQDLQLAALGLELLSSILSVAPSNSSKIANDVVPRTIKFVVCPMLQGKALKSLIKFFQNCVQYGIKEKKLSFHNLLVQLEACVKSDLTRPGYSSIAQCIAGITLKTSEKFKSSTVQKFMKTSVKPGPNQQISLLAIGEIGHNTDLSQYGSIYNDLLTAFRSDQAHIREAASFALGNVTVGNMAIYLPQLLKLIKEDISHEYLLLSSLKENIIFLQNNPEAFKTYVKDVIPLLIERSEAKDEGVRKITAECLGRLGVIDSENTVIPKLKVISQDKSPQVRAVSITALRYTLQGSVGSKQSVSLGMSINEHLQTFLDLLKDSDLDVRREAVLTTRSFLLSPRILINRTHLKSSILPVLFKETKVHPELRHEVDYGNFKEIVDDGLPLRKATFQCLEAVMDTSSRLIDMKEFNKAMKAGLADENIDVQIMTYIAYQKLARAHPDVLLEMLEGFPKLIMSTIKTHLKSAKKPKGNSGVAQGDESTRQQSMKCLRIIVKTMLTFNQIPGVELCSEYQKFFTQVGKTKLLLEILTELDQEKQKQRLST